VYIIFRVGPRRRMPTKQPLNPPLQPYIIMIYDTAINMRSLCASHNFLRNLNKKYSFINLFFNNTRVYIVMYLLIT